MGQVPLYNRLNSSQPTNNYTEIASEKARIRDFWTPKLFHFVHLEIVMYKTGLPVVFHEPTFEYQKYQI